MLKNLTLAGLLLLNAASFAQSSNSGYCASIPVEEQIKARTDISEAEKNTLLKEHAQLEEQITRRALEIYTNRNEKAAEVYVIPVVFHIFHKLGPENISEAQVMDCLRIMNEEYNKSNAKLSQVIPEFESSVGDVQVEFRLAKRDPQGNCNSGINRYYHPDPYFTSQTPINALKAQYIWPRDKYLNAFVVGSIASSGGGRTLGFAQFPGGNASTDGLVMVHDGIGSIGTANSTNQSVTTHEIGHWLGLSHTWGNCAAAGDVAACGCDDNVSDTPNTKGSPSVCDLQESSCGTLANVQNFMDYSFCYAMFTNGQAARMRSVLETVSSRTSLWQPANLIATGADYDPSMVPAPLCKADFMPSSYNEICGGEVVTFTDYSYGSVTSWEWTFPGGVPATSTAKNPVVTYSTSGNFNVTLKVGDGTNFVTTTKNNLVSVVPGNALPIPYVQKFTSVSNLSPDFTVVNPNSDRTWTLNSAVGVDDSKSVYIQARSITGSGKNDDLISNTLDITNLSNPVIRFKYAYARKSSASIDELNIYVSTDCGTTWAKRKVLKGTTLKTGDDVATGDYVPAASEWKQTEISLANYKVSGLKIKFEWITNGGNNAYLDDIMVGENTVGINETVNQLLDLTIYPNPTNDKANLSFELNAEGTANIALYDLLGKQVRTVYKGSLSPGEHRYSIEKGDLTPGIYFIKFDVNKQQLTKKLIFN